MKEKLVTPFFLSYTTTGLQPRLPTSLQNSSQLFSMEHLLKVIKHFISQESAVTRNGVISQTMK